MFFLLMTATEKIPINNEEQRDLKKSVNEHFLVPKHRLLTNDEKGQVLEKFKVKLKQLPKISIKDPVVKTIIDAKIGDIVEITRNSVTAGEAIYYMVIINE